MAKELKDLKPSDISLVQDVYFVVRCPSCAKVLKIKALIQHAVAVED